MIRPQWLFGVWGGEKGGRRNMWNFVPEYGGVRGRGAEGSREFRVAVADVAVRCYEEVESKKLARPDTGGRSVVCFTKETTWVMLKPMAIGSG